MRRDQARPATTGGRSAELRGAGGDLSRSGRGSVVACDRGRLGRSPSTVSREVAGNGGRRRYRAAVADQRRGRRATRPKACKLATNPVLAGIVAEKLQRRWSPQQIAGWLKLTYPDDPEMHVSHESIYRTLFVQSRGALRKELTAYLRTGRVIRRAQGVRLPDGRGGRPGIVNISERPAEAEDRAVPGHWEGDLVFGKRHEPGRHPGRTIHPLPAAGRAAGRQPQGRRRRRRPGRRRHAPARAAGEVADLGPGPRDGRAPTVHRRHRHRRSTSATPSRPGSAAATRTPTACCASTCPAGSTSGPSPRTTSTPSHSSSTTDLDRPSASRHHHKH